MHPLSRPLAFAVSLSILSATDIASGDATAPGPVVISELMWTGSTASNADEWLELYNRSDSAIDLAGWTFIRGDADDAMLVLTTGTIAAGQTFLIANYSADHKKSRLAVRPQYVATSLSLPNTQLRLRLYDRAPQQGGQLIDQADDGRGAPFAGDNALKKAMVRTAFDQPGDSPASWATATEQSGWDPGANEWGTPGTIPARLLSDTPDQTGLDTLIEPTTWADLKGHPTP